MNAREAIKAMLDGHKVRGKGDAPGHYLVLSQDGRVTMPNGDRWGRCGLDDLLGSSYASVNFEIVEESATDEELIAEMERIGRTCSRPEVSEAFALCARMLKTRKVKP